MRKDTYLPEIEREHENRRLLIRFGVIGFPLFVILMLALRVAISSPLFFAKEIIIRGTSQVTESDVQTFLLSRVLAKWWVKPFNFHNMLIWPDTFSESDLRFLPAVKQITVTKNYSERTITVDVTERTLYGIWCYEGDTPRCFWFDETGFMFKRAFASSGNLILVADDYSGGSGGIGGMVLPGRFLPAAMSVFSLLDKAGKAGIGIREIRLDSLDKQEIEVDTVASNKTGGGTKIYFSLRFPVGDDEFLALKSVLNSNKTFQYIDFTVQHRVYYK
jgi:hypothetical protein